ncbi:MAG TPA: AI-2E family transporter [Clostridiales bacterium]|jgi:predicted PurR-regulated permease PerM|nr:AI-2E family transporter [Clostridiales bacterium]
MQNNKERPANVFKTIEFSGNTKEKILSLIILIAILVAIWNRLDIFLLTFIMVFVFYHLNKLLRRVFGRFIRFSAPDLLVYTLIYGTFLALLSIVSYTYMPRIVSQIVDIGNIIKNFDITRLKSVFNEQIYKAIVGLDFGTVLQKAGGLLIEGITNVSIFGFSLFFAIILSYLILVESKRIRGFGASLADSRLAFFYSYFIYFGSNFVNTFGKVMKVQVTIATINALVSMLLLSILGFPQILGLGIMIFFLGLIPVAGVVISLIPLSLIAFNLGGISKVITVLVMIIIIHAIEAYILNPKLMSNKTRLPVSFVFIVLLMAEHYLGVWGLLIGIPLFIFLLTILNVRLPEKKSKG